MIEQFNRLLHGLGGTRIRVEEVSSGYIIFELIGLSSFRLYYDGRILERTEYAGYGGWEVTERSRWLQAVSLGGKRNDEGVISV